MSVYTMKTEERVQIFNFSGMLITAYPYFYLLHFNYQIYLLNYYLFIICVNSNDIVCIYRLSWLVEIP